jgi:prevent-host-death family protein
MTLERFRDFMNKVVGIAEARNSFREIVDQVQYQGDTYVISRNGKPVAAVVPLEVYEGWKRQREEFFDLVRRMQKEAKLKPKDADRLAAEAVQAVRQTTKE